MPGWLRLVLVLMLAWLVLVPTQPAGNTTCRPPSSSLQPEDRPGVVFQGCSDSEQAAIGAALEGVAGMLGRCPLQGPLQSCLKARLGRFTVVCGGGRCDESERIQGASPIGSTYVRICHRAFLSRPPSHLEGVVFHELVHSCGYDGEDRTGTQWLEVCQADRAARRVLAGALGLFVLFCAGVFRALPQRHTMPVSNRCKVSRELTGWAGYASLALWLLVTIAYIGNHCTQMRLGSVELLNSWPVKALGTLLVLTGLGLGVAARLTLGESFPSAAFLPPAWLEALFGSFPPLTPRGLTRYSRNPLVLATYLFLVGCFLLAPSALALAVTLLNALALHAKVCVWEASLKATYGAQYEAYCAQVGRYLPRLKEREPPPTGSCQAK